MGMTIEDLESMRRGHPAWRLLMADSAALTASFLNRMFVERGARAISEAELAEALDDEIFRLRQADPHAYPRTSRQYLADWSDNERGWLRRFYPPGSDEPTYDLTPACEKALTWLASLSERSFVGTESRLLTVFALLRQMVEGAQGNPEERIRHLTERRAELDAEIARVRAGDVDVLDDTALRDRYQQVAATARDLLADFREVEHNFRLLDRAVRARIASWDGSRGSLLDEVIGERDAISNSDQGVSFQAFWDFLMSQDRQEELNHLLEEVTRLPAITAPDRKLRNVLYDWLKAGDSAQRTVALLSQQLRRFLDDKAYLENRRVAELLRGIEAKALQVRDNQPSGPFADIAEARADVRMPMERQMYSPTVRTPLNTDPVVAGDDEFDTADLFGQVYVDPLVLRGHVARALVGRGQVSLGEVVRSEPLDSGLTELIAYFKIADDEGSAVFSEEERERIDWVDESEGRRMADVPLVVFTSGRDGGRD